jgi:hypothetical protein
MDDQPGGSVEQTEDPATHRMTPACVRANQFAATVAGYRAHAIADGLPFRCFPTMRESETCESLPVVLAQVRRQMPSNQPNLCIGLVCNSSAHET